MTAVCYRPLAAIAAAALLLTPATCAAAALPAGWIDCLAQPGPAAWKAPARGRASHVLCRPARGNFTLQIEFRWHPRQGTAGRVELVFGPHAIGSQGYRFVTNRRPWRTVECRGPRMQPRQWHTIVLSLRGGWAQYTLNGTPVARCPVAPTHADELRLHLTHGAQATVRRCWMQATDAASVKAPTPTTHFAFAAESFAHTGYAHADRAADGARTVEVYGRGPHRWLVRGQDGSLPRTGRYVASFGLRAIDGAGTVWLEVARSAGGVLASRTLLLEELPRDAYARVALPFECNSGDPIEYRLAAQSGRLCIDTVTVMEAGHRALRSRPTAQASGATPRTRRALPLADVWHTARELRGEGLEVTRLQRRLGHGGWYQFSATWRQQRAERLDALAVDMWVTCRDTWGRVSVLDHATAYDRTPRGQHTTSAWLGPATIRRLGTPVALFAVLYCEGKPVAAAWRKWGVPVDDKWIVGAPVEGRLRQAPPTE